MSNIIKATILLSFYLVAVSCSDCPNVPTVSELSVQKYLGIWYEIQRFPMIFEADQKCDRAEYSLIDAQTVRVNNSGFDLLQQKMVKKEGKAVVPDATQPGKLLVSFGIGPITTKSNYWVVDTDYTYSLVYSCEKILGIKQEFAWILSRKKTLDQATIDKLHAKLQANGVDPRIFKTTQQDCDN